MNVRMSSGVTFLSRLWADRVSRFVSSITIAALVVTTAGPILFALPTQAAAITGTGATLTISTINGQAPTGHCVAGPLTITGTGETGNQGAAERHQ